MIDPRRTGGLQRSVHCGRGKSLLFVCGMGGDLVSPKARGLRPFVFSFRPSTMVVRSAVNGNYVGSSPTVGAGEVEVGVVVI